MARRKKLKLSASKLKFLFIFGLIVALGVGVYQIGRHLLVHSTYFKIRGIVVDPSLQFIDKKELVNLIGQSIFLVNLDGLQEKLSVKYPQAAHLKIVKRYPDQITIVAKKRLPLARIVVRDKSFMLDIEGILLPKNEKLLNDLPLILGWQANVGKVSLGRIFPGQDIQVALQIIRFFQANKILARYRLDKINVRNLSGISIYLSHDLMVIIDSDHIDRKINILGVMLSQQDLEFSKIKYIDLRFKEPIINKK